MNDEFLQKRIFETRHEIFPLDRCLPLETIHFIFQQEYAKSNDKNLFFKDRKFQRLREGYFAMFVAISLQDTFGKPHYMVFPSNPDNDVYIAYRANREDEEIPRFIAYEFDIKEYTNWSPSFEDFITKTIIPKIDIYNIAIPIYQPIDSSDFEILVNCLKSNNTDKKIWILGLPSSIEKDYAISNVIIINKNGIVYNKTLNIFDWINQEKAPIVYQDVIRFKK